MYRDWREITKALLTRGEGAKLPKSKMARPETKVYVKWVREEIKKHPELFDGYTKGHGIIATRERFLRWLETAEGRAIRRRSRTLRRSLRYPTKSSARRSSCLLRFPASVRCTRSSYLMTLLNVIKEKQPLPWLLRNCSNSDTHRATMFGPKSGARFHSKCQEALANHDVVIADKLRNDVSCLPPRDAQTITQK
jgi:tRNA ligase